MAIIFCRTKRRVDDLEMALHMRGYNYDIPENAESYIHRIGRTGRAGEKSYTCLFIAPNDKEALRKIYKI